MAGDIAPKRREAEAGMLGGPSSGLGREPGNVEGRLREGAGPLGSGRTGRFHPAWAGLGAWAQRKLLSRQGPAAGGGVG